MKHNELKNKTGFTLIELLIVVLIIGILSATALPMYRKSVEKSRVTDALTTMGAVAKSEHAWYLEHSNYTKDFANLDIDLIDEDGERAEGESYDTINYTFTLQDNSIMAERNNGEYTLYKLYEDGNIYCLPQENEICQQFGWGVNRQLCNSINGAWSNIKNACYNSEQERCAATGSTWQTVKGGYCGYYGENNVEAGEFETCKGRSYEDCQYSTFTGEGSTCVYGWTRTCWYSNFYQGAICEGNCTFSNFYSGSTCTGGCQYSTFTASTCYAVEGGTTCGGSTFIDGSVCEAQGGNLPCWAGKFYSGSKCIASGGNSPCHEAQYFGTGCCEGEYCKSGTPRCECDIVNGRHLTSCPEAPTA